MSSSIALLMKAIHPFSTQLFSPYSNSALLPGALVKPMALVKSALRRSSASLSSVSSESTTFPGCKRFGGEEQSRKLSLILDVEQYRYQKFVSDIAGHDIRPHGGQPDQAIIAVRNWLAAASKQERFPGGAVVVKRYASFRAEFPQLCEKAKLEPEALTFTDLSGLIKGWLKAGQ